MPAGCWHVHGAAEAVAVAAEHSSRAEEEQSKLLHFCCVAGSKVNFDPIFVLKSA